MVLAPMTSSLKPYPKSVEVKQKATNGWIAIDQIRTMNKMRLVKRFEVLTEKETAKVKTVIQEIFGDLKILSTKTLLIEEQMM